MLRKIFATALAAGALLAVPSVASASERWPYDDVRFGIRGSTYAGTYLVGHGSVGRVSGGGVDLDLSVMRFFVDRLGFDFTIAGLPPLSDFRGISYGKFEAGLDVGLVRWGGAVPGALIVGAGVGGDLGRYEYAGRLYPRLLARLRLKPSEHVSLFLTTEILPAAVGPETRVFEARTELGFAWRFLLVGLRVGHVFMTGGEPTRDFMQQQLGTFVGVGIL